MGAQVSSLIIPPSSYVPLFLFLFFLFLFNFFLRFPYPVPPPPTDLILNPPAHIFHEVEPRMPSPSSSAPAQV